MPTAIQTARVARSTGVARKARAWKANIPEQHNSLLDFYMDIVSARDSKSKKYGDMPTMEFGDELGSIVSLWV